MITISAGLNAQTKVKESQVPRAVLLAMENTYTSYSVKAWFEQPGQYVADFSTEGQNGKAYFTDDGEWMQRLLHPRFEVDKTYRVRVAGKVRGAAERLEAIRSLDGEAIRPARVSLLRAGRETAELEITIHEGKNRQIRRMCAAAGLSVRRLRRVAEHHLTLGSLPSGKWRFLTEEELRVINGAAAPS